MLPFKEMNSIIKRTEHLVRLLLYPNVQNGGFMTKEKRKLYLQKQLIDMLQEKTNAPKYQCQAHLTAFFECLREILNSDGELKLQKIGRFYTVYVKEHMGFDPNKKEKILVPGREQVRVVFSKKFLNREYAEKGE